MEVALHNLGEALANLEFAVDVYLKDETPIDDVVFYVAFNVAQKDALDETSKLNDLVRSIKDT